VSGKKKTLLWILIILLILIAVLLGLYYGGFLDGLLGSQSGETPTETSQEPSYSEFSGDYISASVPENWTVAEYKDGAGTDMLVSDQTYTGLTGLEIKNPAGDVIFKLNGVYGIGGLGGCQTYFQFSDDSPSYYNEVLSANAEVGAAAPTVVDLTQSSYTQINLFDAKVRRVGTDLYWDTDPQTALFEAACGIQENLFDFGAPQFTVTDSFGGEFGSGIYQFTVLGTATEEELTQLDYILNSLEVN